MIIVITLLKFIPIIIAILVHELAHGWMAYWLGDKTAKIYGRLSFNPIKHVDLFGTIILPTILLFSGTGFIFGWAKPVPIDYRNLKHFRRDILLVASAGVAANLVLAAICALLIAVLPQGIWTAFLFNLLIFNVVLAVFNILPIPPLDGAKILAYIINRKDIIDYAENARQGLIIIALLLFILPLLSNMLHINVDVFGWYLSHTTTYIISLLM